MEADSGSDINPLRFTSEDAPSATHNSKVHEAQHYESRKALMLDLLNW